MEKAINRARELKAQGHTGKQIARVLHQEAFSILEAQKALNAVGYPAFVERYENKSPELFIYENPQSLLCEKLDLNNAPSVNWG